MKNKLHEFYLDWVNNFVSTSGMAAYYQLPEEKVKRMLSIGREIHKRLTTKGPGWSYTPYPQPSPFKF